MGQNPAGLMHAAHHAPARPRRELTTLRCMPRGVFIRAGGVRVGAAVHVGLDDAPVTGRSVPLQEYDDHY